MLPKKNRISRKELSNIFKLGKIINSRNIFLKFITNSNSPLPKISFSVPKGVSKLANKRNFLRRRGYIAIKNELDSLPRGFSGAFVFRDKAVLNFGTKKTKNDDPTFKIKEELKEIINKI